MEQQTTVLIMDYLKELITTISCGRILLKTDYISIVLIMHPVMKQPWDLPQKFYIIER